jgi:hypothetical protein
MRRTAGCDCLVELIVKQVVDSVDFASASGDGDEPTGEGFGSDQDQMGQSATAVSNKGRELVAHVLDPVRADRPFAGYSCVKKWWPFQVRVVDADEDVSLDVVVTAERCAEILVLLKQISEFRQVSELGIL